MSYREEGDSVVLTISREDYEYLSSCLGAFGVYTYEAEKLQSLIDRLNSGNENYTPYQMEKK